jgi:ferredoxin
VELRQRISDDKRYKVPHRDKVIALKDIRAEVELGYDVKLALGEAQRCLNCDIQTCSPHPCASSATPASISARWTASLSPRTGEEEDLRTRLKAPSPHPTRTSMSPTASRPGRVMVKDEGRLLHCGLCAERCPTGAWDMQNTSSI